MNENFDRSNTGSEDTQDTNNTPKQPYDGSTPPVIIPDNLKSSLSVLKALKKENQRTTWIKNRVGEIQGKWDDPNVAAGEKLSLKKEWDRYKEQVPKLVAKRKQLQKKLAEIEKVEAKSVSETSLGDISFGD